MFSLKKSLALATVAVMAAALGTGCSAKKDGPTTANAKVAIDTAALQSDLGSIQITIDAQPGSPANTQGFPITAFLSKAPSGNVWTGNVSQIPATAAGIGRTFTASAYSGPNATGTKLYEGSTVATVTAGQTAQVTIILQELNVQPGPTNYAPVISSITSTAAFLLPGQAGSFSVTAYDPDDASHLNRPQFNGEPLAYQWAASCDNGTLAIASPTAATTAFTAPNVPSALCTVSIKVSETTLANNSSVTTYFTVTVNGNFGNADIFAFPNTSPIVTVRGDFRYNFFSDVPTIPVGQQGDLFFHATDPDGDGVRFDLSANCGSGFDNAGVLVPPVTPVAANQFSAITATFTGGPVAPPAAKSYDFNPTFAYPTPVAAFTDPSKSCSFQIQVHDLCTSGNCGPAGSQGSKADGADRGGATTGFLNATAPTPAKRAPNIVRVVVPNQSGAPVPGVQSWDPQKFVVVAPSTTYNISVEAFDQFEAGPLTITQTCNVGTAGTGTFSTPNGVKSGRLDTTWTSPGSLVADMSCTFTATSGASGLATIAQVHFAGTDPCIGQPNGTACSDGNACTVGETCQAGVCTIPSGTFNVNNGATAPTTGVSGTAVCVAGNQCKAAGVCAANTGTCSDPNAANGLACNADSNGCTVGDSCQAGACTAGPAAVCNAPPNNFCFAALGACVSTGNNTNSCNYTASTGAACSVNNAAAKCNGADQFASFACNAAGACIGQGDVPCTSSQCTTGGTCAAGTGACAGGANKPDGTTCQDGLACTAGDTCQGGICNAGGPACPAGETCAEPTGGQTGPQCTTPPASVVVAQVAKRLDLASSVGLAIDLAGNSYVTGALVTPTKTFDGTNLTSAGAGDVFIGSYDASGNKRWVVNYGDASDQQPQGLAVSSTSVLAHGRFSGVISNGPVNLNAGANTWDYVIFANPGTGALTGGQAIDTGLNGIVLGAGANPGSGAYAICGKAGQLAVIGGTATTWATVAGANTYGGSNDIIIGVYNADGSLRWAKQIGTASDEDCDAVTFDASGNVVAAGVYSGTAPNLTLAGATPLPNPGSSFRRWMWVATFNGNTGAGISQAAFGGGAGQHKPGAVALDSAGNILIAANFTNTIPFNGTNTACVAGAVGCLVSDGGVDGVVLKLSPALAPIWATRVGVSTGDDSLRGVAVDSSDNVVAAGLLNGAATASTVTPSAVASAAVTDPNLTSAGGSSSSFIIKLPGATGLFSSSGAKTTGNATASNTNKVAVNRGGSGSVKDAIAFNGELAGGTLDFGGSSTAITSPSGAATFLVFAKEQ